MLTLYVTVQTRKATLYSMNSWTAKNWNNSFSQIEYRAGAVGLEELNRSRQSWIFTSVSVDCRFQFSYLLFHFSYGPNICLHCTKMWHTWRSTFRTVAAQFRVIFFVVFWAYNICCSDTLIKKKKTALFKLTVSGNDVFFATCELLYWVKLNSNSQYLLLRTDIL